MNQRHSIYKIKIGSLAFCLLMIFLLSLLSTNNRGINLFSSKVRSTNKIHKAIKINKNSVLAESSKSLKVLKQNFVVCIDPGHGAYDNGAKGINGIYEKDVALKVGLKVGQALEKSNIKVVYTRKDDKTVLGKSEIQDLQKRVQISSNNKADVFVSIHCNDFVNQSIRGIELWCNYPNTRDEELAKDIENELCQLKYTKERKVKYKSNRGIYVLKNNKAISTLVELGYLSNKDDCSFLSSDSGQAKCAEAIAKAILKFKKDVRK
ncbi:MULTISPECIES: N-acetylmuramoyl-L-alanine amidase family protein [Clostridium]|uniref:N-acetylmuramoyl-L-alanine amidase family protein n=1 Tax=Clostridium TaxID=1485 RepID=UPI00069EAADF|nr:MULTISPECIES: N-acetylmuramoyl-L-alanine amidase [Clostridium]MCD2345541.1 N-acetylmuramoyl-L-alanine amidase [Clostridium guangxiense]